MIADRIGGLRRVEEEVLYRIRKAEVERYTNSTNLVSLQIGIGSS